MRQQQPYVKHLAITLTFSFFILLISKPSYITKSLRAVLNSFTSANNRPTSGFTFPSSSRANVFPLIPLSK